MCCGKMITMAAATLIAFGLTARAAQEETQRPKREGETAEERRDAEAAERERRDDREAGQRERRRDAETAEGKRRGDDAADSFAAPASIA